MTHNGWKQAKLGDIADITMGNSPPGESYNTSGHGTPLVNGPVEFSEGPLGSTIKSKWTTAPTKHCRQGDLLICVRGSTTGRTNVATFDACIGRGVAAIRALECQPYLNRFLCTLRQRIFNSGKGSTFPSISQEQLACLQIPLPPLPEQKRIAAILDAADALRAKRRESIEQLDSLIQATFLEMFGDPVTNPKGWDVRTLGEACLGKPTYGSGAPASEYDPALPRYVRITDINEAGQLGNERKSAAISPDESEQYRLKLGDLLFARSGATVGKTYLYRQTDGPCVYAGYLIRFCPNPTVLLPEVLFRFTQTRAYWRWVESVARAVAQPNINAKMYAGLNLVIPPLGLQTRFASIVESIEQQKARLKAHLAELDTLFASLQSRAFNGELVA